MEEENSRAVRAFEVDNRFKANRDSVYSYFAVRQQILGIPLSDEEFKCEVCGLSFLSNKELEEHLREHERASELFKCESCKLNFKTREELEKHILEVHGGKK
ncbi:MAG: C2H2-type zinc finger protein [Candidatus Bathyarchaeota archaeon]|nr:MAG: C2H2-type zinc finger protein [Candidatus Bathyarchaeota archaeon]